MKKIVDELGNTINRVGWRDVYVILFAYCFLGIIISPIYTFFSGWSWITFGIVFLLGPTVFMCIISHYDEEEEPFSPNEEEEEPFSPLEKLLFAEFFLPIIMHGVSGWLYITGQQRASEFFERYRFYSLLVVIPLTIIDYIVVCSIIDRLRRKHADPEFLEQASG